MLLPFRGWLFRSHRGRGVDVPDEVLLSPPNQSPPDPDWLQGCPFRTADEATQRAYGDLEACTNLTLRQ